MTIKLKKLKEFSAAFLSIFSKNPFLFFLFLTAAFLFISGLVYYEYGILAKKNIGPEVKEPARFNEEAFNAVSATWQEREEAFENVDFKIYADPFYAK